MKDGLEPGVSNELTITTTPDMGITHLGPDAPSMFSTPAMNQRLAGSGRGRKSKAVEDGAQSGGVHVDVYHLAQTQVGKKVTANATRKKVDGRKYTFDVECTSEDGVKIGEGIHERAVIDISRFAGG